MGVKLKVFGPNREWYALYRRTNLAGLATATGRATDHAAFGARNQIRTTMRGAKMGRMANAVGAGSDYRLKRMKIAKGGGPRSDSWVYLKSPSNPRGEVRTAGAFNAYTKGALIKAKRGTWLAYPTGNLPRKVGNRRLTLKSYYRLGLSRKYGDLVYRRLSSRVAVWFVKTKDGAAKIHGGKYRRKGQKKTNLRGGAGIRIMFIGIRATVRVRRFSPSDIVLHWHKQVPRLIAEYSVVGNSRKLKVTDSGIRLRK